MKKQKRNKFLLLAFIFLTILLIISFYPKDKLLAPVGEPLPVKVWNERTDETEIRYVQVYKTTIKLTGFEMYKAVPGNWLGLHYRIKKSLEVPRGAFYKQYPRYHHFYTFEMGQINGKTSVGGKELLMISNCFSDDSWDIESIYDIHDWGYLFPKGTVVILGCKK